MVYTIKPRSDVYCFKLNFNISNVCYWQKMENGFFFISILILAFSSLFWASVCCTLGVLSFRLQSPFIKAYPIIRCYTRRL